MAPKAMVGPVRVCWLRRSRLRTQVFANRQAAEKFVAESGITPELIQPATDPVPEELMVMSHSRIHQAEKGAGRHHMGTELTYVLKDLCTCGCTKPIAHKKCARCRMLRPGSGRRVA